jgi:anti-anti-sigma factor
MALQLAPSPMKANMTCDVTVVHLSGSHVSLDEATFDRIHDRLLALADEPSASEVLLDFGNVVYLTGRTLGTLVRLHQKLRARGRRLTVANLNPQIYEVFAITKLDRFLNLRLAGQEERDGRFRFPIGVLVVDDDATAQGVLAARLRREGYQVWVADHGYQAVELYRRRREEIAAVLLDVQLPGMDGPHTLTALQRLCPVVCCCFMRENPACYTEDALKALGAVRVFQKPFPFSEVNGMLHQLASRPPLRRQHWWIETG